VAADPPVIPPPVVPLPIVPEVEESVGALSAVVLGAALDMAGLAAIVTDADLAAPGPVIRYVNATFEAMTGHPAADLVGHSPRMLQGAGTDRTVLHRLRRSLEERRHFVGSATNYRRDGSPYVNEWVILPIHAPGGALTHWLSIQRDAGEGGAPHPRAEALHDRTRALLLAVRAIVARRPASAGAGIGGRVAALGRAQERAELGALLRAELEPLDDGGRVALDGPPVPLPRGAAEPIALALHELAVNAARHGALSAARGTLRVTWRIDEAGTERRLTIHWQERGTAPPPDAAARRGYGRQVVEEALPFALGAAATLHFVPNGVDCAIEVPLPG